MKKKYSFSLSSRKKFDGIFLGNFFSAFSGKGIEFDQYKVYSQSDDAKYIDWLASSKSDEILMKQYVPERQTTIFMTTHLTPELFCMKDLKQKLIQDTCELLCACALETGNLFGGMVVGKEKKILPPSSQSFCFERYKHVLAELMNSTENISIQHKQIIALPRQKSIYFFISGSLREDTQDILAPLAQKHDLIYIHISSYFEETLEGKGITHLRTTNMGIGINLDNAQKKQEYQDARIQQKESFKKYIHALGAKCLFLHEQNSLEEEFFHLMKS